MTVGRRLTALLLQAALLTLPLTGAHAECLDDHTAMSDMADMPGMTMPDGADASHHECPADTALHCNSMVVCGPTLMVVEAVFAAPAAPAGMIEALDFPRDPLLSVTRAPEPPPPRA